MLPGGLLYLQFKRSDVMKRSSAREAHLFAALPFYRFHLRRRDISNQHQLMLDLEAAGKHILYAAPGFADSETLNECYARDAVASSSVYVRPTSIGPLMDDDDHHVAFQLGASAYFCSEPVEIETTSIGSIVSAAGTDQAQEQTPSQINEFFENEAENLLSVYEGRSGALETKGRFSSQIRELRARLSPEEFVGQIARVLFETEVLALTSSYDT